MGGSMFVAPDINYVALLPMIIVFVGGLVGVMVEGFASRRTRYAVQVPLSIATLVLALVALILLGRDNEGITAAGGVAGPWVIVRWALAMVRFGALTRRTSTKPIRPSTPAMSSSTTPTMRKASQVGSTVASPKAAAKYSTESAQIAK